MCTEVITISTSFKFDFLYVSLGDEAPNNATNIRIKSKRYLRDQDGKEEEKVQSATINGNFTIIYLQTARRGFNYILVFEIAIIEKDIGGIDVEEKLMMQADGVGGLGGSLEGGIMSMSLGKGEEAAVPSRTAVKTYSIRKQQDAQRKVEQEVRRKRLMDRMANKGNNVLTETDDARIGLTARFKTQRAYADKLSNFHKVSTLPDGVTLRDDPMTKTIAFLNSSPKLT